MTAVFSDSFHWIALADFSDSFHERALALTAAHASQPLVTTDEVPTEYRNYFGEKCEIFDKRERLASPKSVGTSGRPLR